MVSKLVSLRLVRFTYSGESIGNDITIEVEAGGHRLSIEKEVSVGQSVALKEFVGSFVTAQRSFSLPVCAFEECGSGGSKVERLGGFLLGDGEQDQDSPVTREGSYVLVADGMAQIIGVYPRCTVADLPIILPLHPETGALAEPVPKRLAWNASCRPDLVGAQLGATELWREAMRAQLHFSLNGRIH